MCKSEFGASAKAPNSAFQFGDRTGDEDRFTLSLQEVEKVFKILLGELRLLTSRVVHFQMNYYLGYGQRERAQQPREISKDDRDRSSRDEMTALKKQTFLIMESPSISVCGEKRMAKGNLPCIHLARVSLSWFHTTG